MESTYFRRVMCVWPIWIGERVGPTRKWTSLHPNKGFLFFFNPIYRARTLRQNLHIWGNSNSHSRMQGGEGQMRTAPPYTSYQHLNKGVHLTILQVLSSLGFTSIKGMHLTNLFFLSNILFVELNIDFTILRWWHIWRKGSCYWKHSLGITKTLQTLPLFWTKDWPAPLSTVRGIRGFIGPIHLDWCILDRIHDI